MAIAAASFIIRSEFSKLYCKVMRDEMVGGWIIYPDSHADAVRIIGSLADGNIRQHCIAEDISLGEKKFTSYTLSHTELLAH